MKKRDMCFFGRIWKWFLTVLGDIKEIGRAHV